MKRAGTASLLLIGVVCCSNEQEFGSSAEGLPPFGVECESPATNGTQRQGWPGPWDLEVAWHAAGPSPEGVSAIGPLLVLPGEWLSGDPEHDVGVVYFAHAGASEQDFLMQGFTCTPPCQKWFALPFHVSDGRSIVAVSTRGNRTLIGSADPGTAVLTPDYLEADPDCRASHHTLIPATLTAGEARLFNLEPPCSLDLAKPIATTRPGVGVVAHIDGAPSYVNRFELRDIASGEVQRLLGPPLPETAGPTYTLILGSPPVVVEAGDSFLEGRSLSGEQAFKVDLLPWFVEGAPCAGDLNGDGAPEVVIPVRNQLTDAMLQARTLDGELLWTESVRQNHSTGATCSVADLDGDGAHEVLAIDELGFRILDGRTGHILFNEPTIASLTIWDFPVVADLDGDGSSEILVASGTYSVLGNDRGERRGLFAFTHPQGILNGHPPFWPGQYMHHTNVSEDGTLLADFPPWWEDPRTDGHHLMVSHTASCPDLAPTILEVCTWRAAATTELDIVVENIGTLPVHGSATVELRRGDGALVDAVLLEPPPTPGEAVPARLRAEPYAPGSSYTVQVRYDGIHAGCENARLTARWPLLDRKEEQ